jgi:hypothetical protein
MLLHETLQEERIETRRLKFPIPAADLSAAYDEIVRQKLYQRRPDAFCLAVEDMALEVIMLENAYRSEAEELYV